MDFGSFLIRNEQFVDKINTHLIMSSFRDSKKLLLNRKLFCLKEQRFLMFYNPLLQKKMHIFNLIKITTLKKREKAK